jgi:chaperonin GroES
LQNTAEMFIIRIVVSTKRIRVLTKNFTRTIFEGGYFSMIRPLGDRVIIEAIAKEETTASGILLPETAKEKPQEGKVVAAGAGVLKDGVRVPLEVQEGDRIIFSKYAGTEVKYEGRELLILRESDILAVLA